MDWQPIETLIPSEREPVIIAARNIHSDRWAVGEAYWLSNDNDGEWWWANTGPGDYAADHILAAVGPIEFWQPMPSPPKDAQ